MSKSLLTRHCLTLHVFCIPTAFFLSHLECLWLHLLKKSLWRFCCVVELLFFFKTLHFFSICDSLPRALNFVVLNSYKVPLDTSLAWLCNFSHQEDVCNWAEELIPTQFLLIYYLSSQVLLQTFITLANARLQYDTDKRLFFRSNSTCWNNHTWITPSSNTI